MAKQHINCRQAWYQQLHAAFPAAFPLEDAAIPPLAMSIRDDLLAWAAAQGLDERTAHRLNWALQRHCCRRTYQQVVANGGMRVNLQGEPVEPVTPDGQAHARGRIERILAQRAAKAARAVKAEPPVKAPKPEPVAKTPTVIVKKRRRVVIPAP